MEGRLTTNEDRMAASAIAAQALTREAIAHLTESGRPHLLIDHLEAVSGLAEQYAAAFGGQDLARLAGLWHDLGKYADAFQVRIRKANGFESHLEAPEAGRPDHSTAGAAFAMERFPVTALPAALAMAGHHAGLKSHRALKERIGQNPARLIDALAGHPPSDLLSQIPPALPGSLQGKPDLIRLEAFTRFLYSALCDADFLDTEAFYDEERVALRQRGTTLEELRDRLREHMVSKSRSDTEVNRVRGEVLAACYEAASLAQGAFSLTVPTGGGKTLASLAFALEHAARSAQERVIVAIPYTSITEQTTAVFTEVFQSLDPDAVLEHHSMLDPERETPRNRIACENWDAPLIVTTTVQLFESLFANRSSRCRKLHRIARSVIILDEAQTLPIHLLEPVLDMLQALVRDYGCSVVFTTATQPAFERSSSMPEGFAELREIVPESLRAFERLRRVQVRWPDVMAGPMPYEALAEELANESDVLAIVHRRKDARDLCAAMDARLGAGRTYHLSALMCAAHRSEVLAEIRAAKCSGKSVRLVSTQLVEAGVDLDFRVVYRALGGIDAMAQAAGRCNREGRLEGLGELRVFLAPTEPPAGIARTAKGIAAGLVQEGPDLFDPELYRRYFKQLYGLSDRDKHEIQAMRAKLDFEAVAEHFKLIEDDWSAAMVVPFGEGQALVERLRSHGPSRMLMRALQRYAVTVPRHALREWIKAGHVEIIAETLSVLHPLCHGAYDARFGLVLDRVGIIDPATLIIDDWVG